MSLEFHQNDSEETICRGCFSHAPNAASRHVRDYVRKPAGHEVLQVHALHSTESGSRVLPEHGIAASAQHVACAARFLAGTCDSLGSVRLYTRPWAVAAVSVDDGGTSTATLTA